MSLEKIDDENDRPPTFKGVCPQCPEGYNQVYYIHDMKCPICDNKHVVFCPNCRNHWRVK